MYQRVAVIVVVMLADLASIAQCDPIEYNTYFSSQVIPVPSEIQTGEVECYSITQNFAFQVGAIWSTATIDLDNSFEYSYYVNLGSNDDNGADGIVFVLSGDPAGQNAIGETGGFLSYGGMGAITPSVALEFDTWNNGPITSDIVNDHAMFHYNGVMDGSAGPPIDLGNIEDGEYHLVEVVWDAVDYQLTIFFDGLVLVDESVDLVNDVFFGDSEVLVGFTGSTGGFTNIQVICDIQVIYTEECNGIDDDCDGIIDEDTEVELDQEVFICQGESFEVGSSSYTVSGLYTDILSTVLGCDSIINTALTVGQVITYPNPVSICEGESYEIGASSYDATGVYQDTFLNQSGCDSIIETDLMVFPIYETFIDTVICEGDSYQQAADIYTISGSYVNLFSSENGCDSTVFSNLEVLNVDTTSLILSICENEQYTTPMSVYVEAGFYEEVYTAANGCDSLVELNIGLLPISESQQERFICSNGEFQIGTSSYSTAGTYVDTLIAINGCDSIVTTQLGVIDELLIPDSILCEGQEFELDMNPFPFHDIEGFDDIENGIYSFSSSGPGSVTVDLDGCVLSDDFALDFIPIYTTEFYEFVLCEDEVLTIEGRDLLVDYRWLGGETTPSITISGPGEYIKEYEYRCGDFQDRFNVESEVCNCFVYMPSAFTPDGDLVNDSFGPEYSCDFASYELAIYDRFGIRIFHSIDPLERWDGGIDGYYVPSGQYHYVISYKAQDGGGLIDKRDSGVITVVR